MYTQIGEGLMSKNTQMFDQVRLEFADGFSVKSPMICVSLNLMKVVLSVEQYK